MNKGPDFIPFGFHIIWVLSLLGVFVVAGTLTLVVWAVRTSGRTPHPIGASRMQTPLEILARRFASGEITAEEYERARDLLSGGGKT